MAGKIRSEVPHPGTISRTEKNCWHGLKKNEAKKKLIHPFPGSFLKKQYESMYKKNANGNF